MAADEGPAPSPAPSEEPRKGNKRLVLVIVAILIVAALAGTAYFLTRTGPTPSPQHTAPTAAFSVTQQAANTPTQIEVWVSAAGSAAGDGHITSYAWTWGDGGHATGGPVLAHNYSRSLNGQSVTIDLNVTNNYSLSNTVSHSVTINVPLQPPTASFTYTVNAAAKSVSVDASASSSPQGFSISYYVWDWGDGSAVSNVTTATTTHTYAAFGTYTVNLTVIDAAGSKGYTQQSVTVTLQPPTAAFAYTVYASNKTLRVDASASTAGSGLTIAHYVWDWGDGSAVSNVTTATTTHTYAAFGTYTVNLTVIDSANQKAYAEHSVSVAPVPPVALFTYTVYPSNRTVLVDASGSYSPVGLPLLYYVWNWGDGTPVTNLTTPRATHQFSVPGTYTVNLTVIDSLMEKGYEEQSVSTAAQPPVASFTVVVHASTKAIDVDASASFSPIGLPIQHYVWNWGDGSAVSNVSSPTTSHTYAAYGTYTVNLTVIDAANQKGYTEQSVTLAANPVASFTVVRTKLDVSVDASASYSPVGNGITNYAWNWGDGSPVTSTAAPTSSHTYAAAGLYTITLTVTDSSSLTGTTTRFASVAQATLDYTYYDFFNVPYGEWWDVRTASYANDFPIKANCFNATTQATICNPTRYPGLPRAESYPYTDWYNISASSAVYAPFRMNVVGASVPGYNLSEPVFLPVFNYNAAPGSLLTFSWNMQYLDTPRFTTLANAGCIPKADKNDGYILYSTISVTLDRQESYRIFGVPTTATSQAALQTWWNANTNSACGTSGALETSLGSWIYNAASGKYDIWNAYDGAYFGINTNVSATVDASTTTHVTITMIAWGTEAILSRWFYWGNASYVTNQLDSTKAKGWWGQENGWWEDFHFAGNLDRSAMNFTLNAVELYQFIEQAAPGPDGTYHTATNGDTDDVPYWAWQPMLMDYIPAAGAHRNSELGRYPGMNYIHSTPGAANYGANASFDYTPISWAAKAGEVWHFVLPTTMPFVDPNRSPIGGNPTTQLVFWGSASGVAYGEWRTMTPNYGVWNETLWTWDVYGGVPESWPNGSPGQYPYVPYGTIFFVPLGSTPALAGSGSPAVASGSALAYSAAGSSFASVVQTATPAVPSTSGRSRE